MIVSAELETGTVPNVSSALSIPIGMDKLALLVMEVEFGTLRIRSVNAMMKLNGMVLTALRHAQMGRFWSVVGVNAHKANSSNKENASTTQSVRKVQNGMASNAPVSHAILEQPSATAAAAAKPPSMLAPPVPTGTATAAST
jgi:hypothetical protein